MPALAGLVLVAEDDPVNAELLQDLLESRGWRVDVAADGAATLARMADHHYDLLLLDLHMPKVDGVDVLRLAREGNVPRPGWVVVVTADLMYGIREDLANKGADALLSKPINVAALLNILAEAELAAAEV